MASYGDVLVALRDYRNVLERETHAEVEARLEPGGEALAFAARGGVAAFSTPLSNVHATGAGIRVRKGRIVPGEFVIKVYVFNRSDLGEVTPALTKQFGDVEIDVEPLPIQHALAVRRGKTGRRPKAGGAAAVAEAVIPQRDRHRPIVGGLSIAPLNESFVGTLGCFVRRASPRHPADLRAEQQSRARGHEQPARRHADRAARPGDGARRKC